MSDTQYLRDKLESLKTGHYKRSLGKCEGYEIFFEHISYNCPMLGLYGYATERQLRNAVKRLLRKPGNAWKRPPLSKVER